MFTGIIQRNARVRTLEMSASTARLTVVTAITAPLSLGESVAVNGVCLTIAEKSGDGASFDLLPETLEKTTLGSLRAGDIVHVEPPLRLGDPLGGHMVYGHVDGVATVVSVADRDGAKEISFKVPESLLWCVVPKASIALDGVSLTVVSVSGDTFSIQCIPHTQAVTRFGRIAIGDTVNVEGDMVLRSRAHAPMV